MKLSKNQQILLIGVVLSSVISLMYLYDNHLKWQESIDIQVQISNQELLSKRIDFLKNVLDRCNLTTEYSQDINRIDLEYAKGSYTTVEYMINNLSEKVDSECMIAYVGIPESTQILAVLIVILILAYFSIRRLRERGE